MQVGHKGNRLYLLLQVLQRVWIADGIHLFIDAIGHKTEKVNSPDQQQNQNGTAYFFHGGKIKPL